jgi:uncharacterized protein YprB with RNaseH-like and TPR domain/predicted nuclease with RNAse H fold/dephospho-CoA kinase
MLWSTFQHLVKGIGAKKEAALWLSGVASWEDLQLRLEPQLVLFASQSNGLKNGAFFLPRKALEEEDTEFFAQRLPRPEHYRIALSFPRKTLFLDIETTGLSRHYDTITMVGWSMASKYSIYVKGGNERPLRAALREAKAIVTFNGTLFDLPFLRQEFPALQIPTAHIDLRFLARRVGLSGGQKIVERLLGLERPGHLQNLEGETAPLLWYRSLRGDREAFKLLLAYNRADVEGLRLIFDAVVARLLEKYQVPKQLRSVPRFAESAGKLKWPKVTSNGMNEKRLFPRQRKASLTVRDLASGFDLARIRIVGIDLTGSENRPSGWCALKGEHAFTQRLGSDDDLVEATLEAKPTLVSIDSPLSLPKGRIRVSDDDPGRETYGITRECERTLKKRGINVYPCLINSMQNLTARGMRLAARFRSLGIPVIESYPGAAQDIMNIPRKRASLEFLKTGLAEFGITGDFLTHPVSHDELDAITAAIVGLFFWSGKFEALGNEEEDYLIIPALKVSPNEWKARKVIGLSGPIAAGKTTAGEFLRSRGFSYGRFSLVLADILRNRGISPSRDALQRFGEEVNKDPGQRWLCQQLIRKLPNQGNLVIDGLRFPEDHASLVEAFGPAFLHVYIDAPDPIRRERFIAAGGTPRKFANASAHPVEASVNTLASLAHVVVRNDGSMRSFLSKILQIAGREKHDGEEALACL